MEKILALDLGTTTGWALFQENVIHSGSVSFKDTGFDSKDSRFGKFRRWLENVRVEYALTHIVYEAVMRHGGVHASHVYGGFMGVLQAFGDEHGIPYEGVSVGTIKKHATGKGNASKQDMMLAMTRKGHTPQDDNEADALALLYWRIELENNSLKETA